MKEKIKINKDILNEYENNKETLGSWSIEGVVLYNKIKDYIDTETIYEITSDTKTFISFISENVDIPSDMSLSISSSHYYLLVVHVSIINNLILSKSEEH